VDVWGGDHAARLHRLEQETAVALLLIGLLKTGLAVLSEKTEVKEYKKRVT